MRFVVDDAPWAPETIEVTALEGGLDALTDRLFVARSRNERTLIYEGIWDLPLVGSDTLVSLIYDTKNSRSVHRDVRRRLQRQLDQLAGNSFNEAALISLEATIGGVQYLTPSGVLAWQYSKENKCLACLTPKCSGRSGPTAVTVNGELRPIHFVDAESVHVDFFRAVIRQENADEFSFAALAPSAFPNLCFVENVWRGLRDLSRPYRDRRDDIVYCLSVLSDHGARIFALKEHKRIEAEFMSLKIEISPESSEALANSRCRLARERVYGGETLVFDWHIKIQSHVDRIHIHPGTSASDRKIIVGIITEHLPLPGD